MDVKREPMHIIQCLFASAHFFFVLFIFIVDLSTYLVQLSGLMITIQ